MQKTVLSIKQVVLLTLLLLLFMPTAHSEDWVYTTRPGDSIWNISQRFLINVNDWKKLQEYNKVTNPQGLQPGTKIHIPYTWLSNQPKSARLIATQGTVAVVNKAGIRIEVIDNLPLNNGYQIQTADQSYAIIEFADGSRMAVKSDSILMLNQINYVDKAAIVDTQMRLKRGNISSDVIPFQKPQSRFEIMTPAAVAAVRGTKFHLQVPNETSMLSSVDEGTVLVSNPQGESVLNAGFGTVAEVGKPPSPPIKLLPKANLAYLEPMLMSKDIKFSWPSVSDAMSYYVEIRTQDDDNNIVFTSKSHQPIVKVSLPKNGKYILFVRAIDKIGLQGLTAIHKFNAGFASTDALAQPKLNSPSNGDEVQTNKPTFHWFRIDNVKGYRVQVSSTNDFSDLIIDQVIEQQFFRISAPLSEGNYFWRVAAISSNDELGPFSEYYSLLISE